MDSDSYPADNSDRFAILEVNEKINDSIASWTIR